MRRAEMQLRARIPRQPGQRGGREPGTDRLACAVHAACGPAGRSGPAEAGPRAGGVPARRTQARRLPRPGSTSAAQETAAGTGVGRASEADPAVRPAGDRRRRGEQASWPASQGDAASAASTLSPAPTSPGRRGPARSACPRSAGPGARLCRRRARTRPLLTAASRHEDSGTHDPDRG